MRDIFYLIRTNRNYRYTWLGQIVSEVGDHFNTIAVFALVMQQTQDGLAVAGVLLARAFAMLLAGPAAGVLLDRMDRRHIMIASDLIRAITAGCFIFCIGNGGATLVIALSAALMFASPFFTSGRSSILPVIASKTELHTANSLTQTTQWTAVTLGAFLGGTSVVTAGYEIAFLFNAASFLFSAYCVSRLKEPPGGSFRAPRRDTALTEAKVARPLHEYVEGLRYMGRTPLVFAIMLVGVGWASGGGAAQILFSLMAEKEFQRGAAGIGEIWGCAGLGLICGGAVANTWGKRLSFNQYKGVISAAYVVHGGTYVLFSQLTNYPLALLAIGISRFAVAISSVLNFSQLLRHVEDRYRGRVFATMETSVWAAMIFSMLAAGLASRSVSARTIGAISGVLSSTTAIFWAWANWAGKLPEPAEAGIEPEEVEVHGDPRAAG